jgi:hypothetical protein
MFVTAPAAFRGNQQKLHVFSFFIEAVSKTFFNVSGSTTLKFKTIFAVS